MHVKCAIMKDTTDSPIMGSAVMAPIVTVSIECTTVHVHVHVCMYVYIQNKIHT